MDRVRPKKHLGQHFLKDQNIARKIAESLTLHGDYKTVLEVGPGTGVLTQFLIDKKEFQLYVSEIDKESVAYLQKHFASLEGRIIDGDFLKMDLETIAPGPLAVIGNFPYNISSQIFFKVLDNRQKVPEVVGMIQKEVAVRIAEKEGSRDYGILSVLLQAYYDIDLLFTVPPGVFHPPPKVNSAVIRLKRNKRERLPCDEDLFRKVVKTAFQKRRKTLRNALKELTLPTEFEVNPILQKRAEQLSVEDFFELTLSLEKAWKQSSNSS
ncbi:16S rRNA (adenine(1518)-N(6)/adenine(1519)-N(6))-dimethyltransferase RsmA [uncultured Imperialibacter sp.]|uniref:16S rRNA (adenine(1518)-N(6)/adenine(1519)-N(6))- dimethyltransferase RsmA n=1 Tax=uncultured Imperialibacter sp. TaxID=1672639 RepID=UPI0030DCDCDF|tara:strand:+ start:10346 stop:11146 length:801 start_codon:yes stop_codon:yes gene_type:complete